MSSLSLARCMSPLPGRPLCGTIGEFAPGALAGPGGMVRKTAMLPSLPLPPKLRANFTSGSSAEPYVRTAAAIAAGVPVAMAGRNRAMSQMRKNAPSLEEARAAKNADTSCSEGWHQVRRNGYQAFADDWCAGSRRTALIRL